MSGTGGETIRVLHVDDEPGFVDVAAEFLEREHEALEVVTETSASDGLDRLETTTVDCIVSDYDMPRMDGLDFLEAVRDSHPDLPFILFTGKGSEEIASDAISAGVTEYLQKETGTDQYAVLANRIERAVGEMRAREALEESERMLSMLISNLPGMVYRSRNEEDWPMEFVSEGCQDLTGYAPEQLVDGDIEWGPDVLHPEDAGTMWEPVQEALDAGESFEVTYRIRTADGETRWAWEQGRGVYEDGEVVAIEGFITDITERREAKQRLRQYESIVESMPDGAFVVDGDEEIQFVNEAAAAMLERPAEDVIGDHVVEITDSISDEARHRYEEAVAAIRSGEQTRASTTITAELLVGERTIDLRMQRLGGETTDSVVGIARDLSHKAERDRELERYETIVQAVGDMVYALDEDGTFTFVNDAFGTFTGYAPADLVGEHVSKLLDESDIRKGEEKIRHLLETEEQTTASLEMDVPDRDGRRIPCENRIALLPFGENGEFRGTAGIVRDISERETRERNLEQYETLVENVGDPMYALDENAVITMANDAMADHLNCTVDDLVGEPVSTVMADEDVETGTQVIADLIADDDRRWDTFEIETISVDGERKQTEDKVGILTDEDGNYTGSVGVIRDITERKQREQQLERYETIIQAVGDTVYAIDEDGRYTFVNDAIEDYTGYRPAELMGEHVSIVMDEADVEEGEEHILRLLKSDDATTSFEMDIVNRDGGRVPHENRIALLPFGENGEFRGTAGIVRDISERKQREERLEQFASVVSHDLRNPLNVIEGRVELLQQANDGGEHVDAIANAAARMDRLIEDLLTLARQGETVGETKRISLEGTAKRAWEHVETGAATLVVEEGGTLEGDPDRLLELFENLFHNAVEHGRPDATVKVGVDDSGDGQGHPARIYVADDGEGIDVDDHERVFEHGFSNSDDGTGFGLSIVRNVADAHGWSVSISESQDGGARFDIVTGGTIQRNE